MQCSFYQFSVVTMWMLEVLGDSCCCFFLETRVGKRVNWFELSNCLWSFPFSCCATKAASASISVSLDFTSLSGACDLAKFGDRPTQIRLKTLAILQHTLTCPSSANLAAFCGIFLFELSTVVEVFFYFLPQVYVSSSTCSFKYLIHWHTAWMSNVICLSRLYTYVRQNYSYRYETLCICCS